MASTLTQDASKVDMAISAAESFTKLYYEYVDKMRHKLNKLYHQEGILVWNGNQVAGAEKIQKFFEELPSSIHSIISLDSQPLASNVVNEQTTILITTSGFVTYNANKQPFQQTFLITAVDENWKVVSDCLRARRISQMHVALKERSKLRRDSMTNLDQIGDTDRLLKQKDDDIGKMQDMLNKMKQRLKENGSSSFGSQIHDDQRDSIINV